MIRGLGNDITEIERIRSSIDRHGQHFLNRLFSQKEQDYCARFEDSAAHFAGRFAAKEAIAKALGTGFGADLSWLDIEILNDEKGRPIVHMTGGKWGEILVSISHGKDYAIATAIVF